MKSIYTLIISLIIFTAPAFAQDRLLTVNFQQAGIKQVVADIEKQSDYYFYYEIGRAHV